MGDFITLLSRLADGRAHSVGELARVAGIPRARVRSILEGLHRSGMPLDSVADEVRWRLASPLLDARRILEGCAEATRRCFNPVVVLADVDSTSTWLIEDVAVGTGAVCVAERQGGGRGRRGNRWFAAPGASLCFSLRWRFAAGPERLSGLSLAVGVAVARVLRQRYGLDVGLKWPNDLYLDDRKLGGILVELPRVSASACEVVVGIGINTAMERHESIEQAWTSLHRHLPGRRPPDRNTLLASLLDGLAESLPDYPLNGKAALLACWRDYDITFGRMVRVIADGETVAGTGQGIDADGRFRLQTGTGRRVFSAADVSVRVSDTAVA